MTTTLTERQKRRLRSLAHARKAVVQTGAAGLTPAVLREIEAALTCHELVKVRVLAEERTTRDAMIATILSATGAALVQRIGHVATLFRRNPEKPRIELPA